MGCRKTWKRLANSQNSRASEPKTRRAWASSARWSPSREVRNTSRVPRSKRHPGAVTDAGRGGPRDLVGDGHARPHRLDVEDGLGPEHDVAVAGRDGRR